MADLPDDASLISALRNDNERVFESLFRFYYQKLCNYAASLLHDLDEAEEIVQQTMIAIWERRKKLETRTSLKSYLYRSVHNGCLNKIRHEGIKSMHIAHSKAQPEEYAPSASAKIDVNELEENILDAVNNLPEQCRMVFKLSRYENLRYVEIASLLGISVKTVENHMGRALKLLRESLKEYITIIISFIAWLVN